MKTLETIIAELHKPLPTEALKPHSTKPYLTTIKPIFVIERLNEVYGISGWSFSTEIIKNDGKMVVMKGFLSYTIDGKSYSVEQYGGNNNDDFGDAHKGASTDALTKCASYIGIGMDIYKGKCSANTTAPSNGQKYPEDKRPWLKENQLIAILKRKEAGELDIVKKTLAAFRMSKEFRARLEAI